MAIEIQALHHISIHVADVEKSIDFYKNALCLPMLPRPKFDFDGAWFMLGSEQQLHLIAGRENAVHSASRGNHFALQVTSIKEVEIHFKALNISYCAPKQRPDGVWQLFVKDPDGYFIELTELKQHY